jgi:hypothetical protein
MTETDMYESMSKFSMYVIQFLQGTASEATLVAILSARAQVLKQQAEADSGESDRTQVLNQQAEADSGEG